jgi:hypothetical protein
MRVLISLFLIILSSESFGDPISGNQLYDELKEWKNSEKTQTPSLYKMGRSLGYIQGLTEMDSLEGKSMCVPSGVTNGQIMDVILNFLEKYPENRHKSAAILSSFAIWEAFPCAEKKEK